MPFRLPFYRARRHRKLPARVLRSAQMKRLVRREQARSDRSLLPVSLICFELETLPSSSSLQALQVFCQLCSDRIRDTDDLGEIDDFQIAILLPETPREGSDMLAKDLQELAEASGIKLRYRLEAYSHDDPRPPSSSNHSRPGGIREADFNESRQHSYSLDFSPIPSRRDGLPTELESAEKRSDPSRVPASKGPAIRTRTGHSTSLRDRSIGDTLNQAKSLSSQLSFAQCLGATRDFSPRWKRGIDVCGAVAGLTLLSPLLFLTWLLVRITSPGPGIYAQLRDGYLGETFTIYKFRTMRLNAESEQPKLLAKNEQDGPAFKLVDDPRVTPLGALLRKTCIDELPQLWNVLRGEMSLVGPRPLPCEESAQCASWQSRRLLVKPGLTCFWQTYRSTEIPFVDWMRMDLRYARRLSIRTDFQLVGATLLAIAGKRPIFRANQADTSRNANHLS